MQRKLIGYDVFRKLTENSLPATQYELVEAETILSKVLETGPLSFHHFDENQVIYETQDGTFLRANYKVAKDAILFEGIEEIVIDEQSQVNARKDIIRNMIDAVLENNKAKADDLFDDVMGSVRDHLQREAAKERNAKVNEATSAFSRRKPRRGNKSGSGVFVRYGPPDAAKSRRAKEGHRKHPLAAFKSWETRKRHDPKGEKQKKDRKLFGRFRRQAAAVVGRKHKKTMTEWLNLSENVLNYIDYVESSRSLNEASIKTTPQGDITAVKIPSSQARNEGKILSYQLKNLKTDLKVLRETARRLASDRSFVDMVAELKRHNNLSDNSALEECLGEVVSKFPSVLYLTQDELSNVIGESLSRAGVSNYDDRTCQFMSEGILRVAHGAYNDRVSRIHQLSGKPVTETEDPYIYFQNIIGDFYPTLDEHVATEMQVFVDLYNASLEVRRMALEAQNESLKGEAEEFAGDLHSVIEGESVPSLELAATVAGWLENIVESNLESEEWDVVKTPHVTDNGDHPQMSKNAKQAYSPSQDFSGDWGKGTPQLDGEEKGYKNFGGKSSKVTYVGLTDDGKDKWGEMYPNLDNPYVLKGGNQTLKNEPGVDKNMESGLAMHQGDTYPNVNNPYVPKSVKRSVSSDNRVDDGGDPWTDVEVR